MTQLDALLTGIVADPREETRWLVLADWLQENDQPERAELLRLHRKLLATCLEPDSHPERAEWQARVVELLVAGVRPCVPQETLTLPGGVPMTFSFIPPGAFLMGSDHPEGNADERPVHRVEIARGFCIGVYPVTQAQWFAVMGTAPSHFKGAKRPVEQVSWDDCQVFCEKVSGPTGRQVRLPTEAEWEFACRAGSRTEYHFGDVISTDLVNYDGKYTWNNSPAGKYRKRTTNVDSFLTNAWGLSDLHGNVWEWCANGSAPNTESQQGALRHVLRGGCWRGISSYCRTTIRYHAGPQHRANVNGFRVCFHPD